MLRSSHFTTLLVLLTAIASRAALTVTQPTTAHYWVGNSSNTLAWSGTTPDQFSVFIYNPDISLLTDKLAIFAIVNTYITSLTLTPTVPAGDGYTLLLTDILNSTNIYATSEPFKVAPQGSLYATDTTSMASDSAAGSATGSTKATGTVSTAAKATASEKTSAGEKNAMGGLLGTIGLVGLTVGGVTTLA